MLKWLFFGYCGVLGCGRILHCVGGFYRGLLDYTYWISGLEQILYICSPTHTPFIFAASLGGQGNCVLIVSKAPPFVLTIS